MISKNKIRYSNSPTKATEIQVGAQQIKEAAAKERKRKSFSNFTQVEHFI